MAVTLESPISFRYYSYGTAPIDEMKLEETSLSKGNFHTDVQRQFQQTVAAPLSFNVDPSIFAKSKPCKPVRFPTSKETMGRATTRNRQADHYNFPTWTSPTEGFISVISGYQLHEKCLLRGSASVLSLFVTLTE